MELLVSDRVRTRISDESSDVNANLRRVRVRSLFHTRPDRECNILITVCSILFQYSDWWVRSNTDVKATSQEVLEVC